MVPRLLLSLSLALLGPSVGASPRETPEPAGSAPSLKAISTWLQESGRDGFLAADVADAAGIPRLLDEQLLHARQRGFRSGEVLRIAQVATGAGRDFLLFMVQQPDGEVQFYFATLQGSLKKAFISLPLARTVVPITQAEAERAFRAELRYWEARRVGR